MKELQRWLDNAPTLRRCLVEFNGTWYVKIWRLQSGDEDVGVGIHASLTFAVVAAILALESDT